MKKIMSLSMLALISISLLGTTTLNVKADESLIQTNQTTLMDIENENTVQYDNEGHNIERRWGRGGAYRLTKLLESNKHSKFYNPNSGFKGLIHNIQKFIKKH